MVQRIQAEKLTLYDLVNNFKLRLSKDEYFFSVFARKITRNQ
jgi:hypothetical protein